MKNKLKRGSKKPSDDHTNHSSTEGVETSSTHAVRHPNKQWYETKAATIAIPLVLVAIAVTGYFISQNASQQNTADKSSSKEAATNNTAVSNGLKKFTSKNHGLTFTTPESWQVAETKPTSTAENAPNSYVVTVRVPVEGTAAGLDFRIIEGTVDELLKQTLNMSNVPEGVGFQQTAVKWKGMDATRLTVNAAQDRKVTVIYVQAGKFVYILPEYENPPNGDKGKVASDSDWKSFTDSIEVKA